MENARIRQLPGQMAALEDDLCTALHEQESRVFFQIKGKQVEFERSIRQAHHKLKIGFFRWLLTNRPQNLITDAGKVLGTHSRYAIFLVYGEATDYEARLEEFRVAFRVALGKKKC